MGNQYGYFSGDPAARWLTEVGPDREMKLIEDFSFTDPDESVWLVPSGYIVDGASMPKALWSLIGSPYTGDYRRASIVHDKACEDTKSDSVARKRADRIFYLACRAGGCSSEDARSLYLGVRIGALSNIVPIWLPGFQESFAPRPRTSLLPAERGIEAAFRISSGIIEKQGLTDDPFELERRVDAAFKATIVH